MDDKWNLSSLRRGLETLRILNSREHLTGSELAAHLKTPRTTAHRILETLANEGYLVHDEANHRFYLSPKVRHIAFGFNRDCLLAEVARPVLQALCRETLMPVGLTSPVGQQMVTQVSTDHDAPLALDRIEEGTTFPLTFGASGHIYLAHCAKDVRDKLISTAILSTHRSAAYAPPSDAEFDRIRSNKYAFSPYRDGSAEGLVAVPIYLNGDYVAGIHLRFMKKVFTKANVQQSLLPKLQAAALEIERRVSVMIQEMPELYSYIKGPLLISENLPIKPNS
jgi:DNA-binding IclR family transcriptional regulator